MCLESRIIGFLAQWIHMILLDQELCKNSPCFIHISIPIMLICDGHMDILSTQWRQYVRPMVAKITPFYCPKDFYNANFFFQWNIEILYLFVSKLFFIYFLNYFWFSPKIF
jgi:hypothetical protein